MDFGIYSIHVQKKDLKIYLVFITASNKQCRILAQCSVSRCFLFSQLVLSLDFVEILNCLILVFSSSTRNFKIIACNFSYSHTVYSIIFSLKFFWYDKLTCFLLKFNWIVKSRILMAMWKNLHTGTLTIHNTWFWYVGINHGHQAILLNKRFII